MGKTAWIARVAGLLLAIIATLGPASAEPRRLPADLAFTLTDQHGAPFTAADLKARPTVIHFGYTGCPVICPTTLYEVASRLTDLGDDAARLNFLFVTVDPDRDTPAFLATYIANFDRRIVGLSGDPAAIATLAAAVGATYSKSDSGNGDYTMDHSVNGFLIDADGAISELYLGSDSRETIVMRKLRELAASASRTASRAGTN